jgi:arylsulfatase A-like enzyme
MAFLQAQEGDRPWLCAAGFYSPHAPWIAPQEFLDLYDRESLATPVFPPEVDAKRGPQHFSDAELRSVRHGYYAMVSEVDHHVGRILECLREIGQAEETIVLYTSDHGEWLGEHLRYGKGYPGHDAVSRTPLIVRAPEALAPRGRTVRALVEAVDVVPTLLSWAGAPVPADLQGRRLPTSDDEGVRPSALSEMTGWKTIRTDRMRYVLRAEGQDELYDLQTDPGGYRNVARDAPYAGALSQMRKELARRTIEREQPLERVWDY